MIVVKLQGGLGNQMFQYAAGRALALKHRTELKLDVTTALGLDAPERASTPRFFELDKFAIEATVASKEEISSYRWVPDRIERYNFLTRARRKTQKTVFDCIHSSDSYYIETGYNYDKKILELPDNVYIDGYFQSAKYFAQIREELLREFTLRDERFFESFNSFFLSSSSCALQPVTCSIHVRRGDYVTDKRAAAFHGSCPLEYYRNAVEKLKKMIDGLWFIVFSDDLEWCRKHLTFLQQAVFMDGRLSAQEEMTLMSRCDHHIIANSSFSWWGAWLNRSEKKKVIYPKRWFAASNDNAIFDLTASFADFDQ